MATKKNILISRADQNGYITAGKSGLEMLADREFLKSVFGVEEELKSSFKYTTPCECGRVHEGGMAAFDPAWKIRLDIVMGGLDEKKPESKIWDEISQDRLSKKEAHDDQGNLLLSKLK